MGWFRQFLPYAVALCSTTAALVLSLWLGSLIDRPTVIVFFIAVAISTRFGGSRPGIVTIVLSVLFINYFWVQPLYHFGVSNVYDNLWLGLFVVVSLTVNGLIVNLRRSNQTIKQLSQKLLERSSERLNLALNAAQIGLWDWDLVSGEVQWSQELEQLFGMVPGQFDKKYETFEACIHPDDRAALNQALEQSVRDRTPHHHEFRVVWADGTIHWIEGRGQTLCDEAGVAVRMSGTAMDVDQRKQAEAALWESRNQIQQQLAEIEAIYQNAPIGLNVLDSELRFVRVNEQLAEINGFSVEAHMGRTVRELLPDLADTAEPLLRSIIETGEPLLNVELTGETPAQPGVKRTWIEHFLPLRDGDRIIGISTVCEEITERKQAEDALRQSEARLRLAQAASNSAVWDFDMRTKCFTWSPETYQLYQLAPHTEATFDNWLHCLHPDDQERTRQQTLQAVEDKLPELRVEFRVRRAGEIRWFTSIGQIFYDDRNDPIRVIGSTIDITPQKRAEIALQELNTDLEHRVMERTAELAALTDRLVMTLEEQQQTQIALRASEESLRLILDLTHIGTWDWQIQNQTMHWNDNHFRLLGLSPHSVEASHELWCRHVHPDDLAREQQRFSDAMQAHTDLNTEYRVIYPDGSIRWVMARARGLYDDAGLPLRAIGVLLDITDRKQMEMALAQEIARRKALLDTSIDGVVVVDQNGYVIEANASFARMLGYSMQEMATLHLTDFDAHWTDDELEQMVEHQQLCSDTFETRHRRKDGSIYHVEISSNKFDWDGQSTHFCICRDISGRKQAEQALAEAKVAAEAANRAKSTFLANMSHELRTPLNAILGFSQLLLHSSNLSVDDRDHLNLIYNSGNYLLKLINDILDLSKVEAGKETLTIQPVDLVEQLQTIRQLLSERIERKRLHFQLDIASDVPSYILADGQKLVQVLLNLVSNAIKFTQQGGVALHVNTSAAPITHQNLTKAERSSPALMLCFTVNDTGMGIAPTDLNRIFEAFTQTAIGQQAAEGTGLGLTISRRLAKLMGGDITVQSVLGQGSTFTFTVPVQAVSQSDQPKPRQDRPRFRLAPDQPVYRVLVVDDQSENRLLLRRLLKPVGVSIQEAATGEAALQIWQQWQPHLIWLDIRLPGIDGYEVAQQIRTAEHQQLPRANPSPGINEGNLPTSSSVLRDPTVIIALTAQALPEDQARAIAAGCDDYLSKPFDEADLLRKLAQYLGLRQLPTDADFIGLDGAPTVVPALTADHLAGMPTDWVKALYKAALLCEDHAIEPLLLQIPATQVTLVRQLENLIYNFEFQVIMDVTASYLRKDEME